MSHDDFYSRRKSSNFYLDRQLDRSHFWQDQKKRTGSVYSSLRKCNYLTAAELGVNYPSSVEESRNSCSVSDSHKRRILEILEKKENVIKELKKLDLFSEEFIQENFLDQFREIVLFEKNSSKKLQDFRNWLEINSKVWKNFFHELTIALTPKSQQSLIAGDVSSTQIHSASSFLDYSHISKLKKNIVENNCLNPNIKTELIRELTDILECINPFILLNTKYLFSNIDNRFLLLKSSKMSCWVDNIVTKLDFSRVYSALLLLSASCALYQTYSSIDE